MLAGLARGAEVLEGLDLAAFGLAADGEYAFQLLGPGDVEQGIDDAFGGGAFLHFAFDDAGAADGPEGMHDGADALVFELGAGFELESDGVLEVLEFGDILGGDVDFGVSRNRDFGLFCGLHGNLPFSPTRVTVSKCQVFFCKLLIQGRK